jgi:hypothetical protein
MNCQMVRYYLRRYGVHPRLRRILLALFTKEDTQ